MSKRIFTPEQISELLTNAGVANCSDKSVTYSKQFKTKAIKLYEQGMSAREIFRQAGFKLQIIGGTTPKGCLKRWNKTYRDSGIAGLSSEARGKGGGGGRPKKIKDANDADKIKRLEAEVAYLKAENDFLAKLRASQKR